MNKSDAQLRTKITNLQEQLKRLIQEQHQGAEKAGKTRKPRTHSRSGVVRSYMAGTSSATGTVRMSSSNLAEVVLMGLPVHELEELRTRLDIPLERLAPKVGLSKATLHRRKLKGKLGPNESDRVVRYARLMGRAIEVMEEEEAARKWMTSPQAGLGGAIPIDFAETEVGAREIEDLLGRIEHGVYS